MDLLKLQDFFMWMLIINMGMLVLMLLSVAGKARFCMGLMKRISQLEEKEIRITMFRHVANYELLIGVFSLMPFLALVIMNNI